MTQADYMDKRDATHRAPKQGTLPLDRPATREALLTENIKLRKLLADAYAEIRSYDQKLFRAHAARSKAERRAV